MDYLVIGKFADVLDNGHVYREGDMYPREGYTPSESRIAELTSYSNRLGKPLIEEAKPEETKGKQEDTEKPEVPKETKKKKGTTEKPEIPKEKD